MEARRDKRLGVRSMTSVEYRASLVCFEIRTADAVLGLIAARLDS
jgi:hypothetical protein